MMHGKGWRVGRTHRGMAWCAFAAAVLLGASAEAQPIRATVQSIQTPAPDLDEVVSGASGDTVFRVSPATGAVTRVSGTGNRVGSGTTRALVTLHCANQGMCDSQDAYVTIGPMGSPTGRARTLTNFTVAEGTARFRGAPLSTNPLIFRTLPIGRNSTATFWIGADFPIAGDDSGLATGDATSAFYVSVALLNNLSLIDTETGLAVARIFRPIVVGLNSNLSFGTVTKPRAGTGTVTLDAQNGNRTVTGTGAQGISVPAAARASFTISGEGGQTISVHVPPTFIMSGPGTDITVTTDHTAAGTQMLGSALGATGTFPFHVGGSFPTTSTMPVGTYSGTFTVMVQYN